MLSQEIANLESENQRLKSQLAQLGEHIQKPKNCASCKHYVQHYGRDAWGTYYKIYIGHCNCNVPIKERRGKKNPTPENVCLCFEEGFYC